MGGARFDGDLGILERDAGAAIAAGDSSSPVALGFAGDFTADFVCDFTAGVDFGLDAASTGAAAGLRCTTGRVPGLLPVAIRDASARVVLITGAFFTGCAFGIDSSSELTSGELMMVLRGDMAESKEGWLDVVVRGMGQPCLFHTCSVIQMGDCYVLLVALLLVLEENPILRRRVGTLTSLSI